VHKDLSESTDSFQVYPPPQQYAQLHQVVELQKEVMRLRKIVQAAS